MNNKDVFINAEIPVYIYGAGIVGQEICAGLLRQNINVAAYIDQKADSIREIDGRPVFQPDEIPYPAGAPQRIAVISVLNVFVHSEIAGLLRKYGFDYIIFNDVIHQYGDAGSRVTELYNKIMDNKDIQGMSVPKLTLQTERFTIPEPVSEGDGMVVEYVPAEMLKGASIEEHYKRYPRENMIEQIYDKNICDYLIMKELYKGFEQGCAAQNRQEYLKLYKRYRTHMLQSFDYSEGELEEIFEKHLCERYDVYQYLCYLYEHQYSYFVQNPARVQWNGGSFNIADGNNRIAFLMAKGMLSFPCRMKKGDYEKWICKDKFNELKVHLTRGSLKHVRYPVTHTGFRNLLRSRKLVFTAMECIFRFLREEGKYVPDMAVLDLCGSSGYFAQQLYRAGAKVYAYADMDEIAFMRLVNELVYCKGIEVSSDVHMLCRKDVCCAILDGRYFMPGKQDLNELLRNHNFQILFVLLDGRKEFWKGYPDFMEMTLLELPYENKLARLCALRKR